MSSLTTFGTIMNTVWSLFFIAPLYIILSTVLSKGLIYLHQLSLTRSSYIYQYLGDISWAIPINSDFKLTQVLLLAITLALLSMLILGFMLYSTYGENKYQQTKARLLEEIKKEQDKINHQESENADQRREEKEKEQAQKQQENDRKKKTSEQVTSEMQRRRLEELEEMKKRQEEMIAEEKKYQEERKKQTEQKSK